MADFYANALLTSTNATIIVDGLRVGNISDLSFTQRYDVVPFTPIGASVPRVFVTGAYSGMGNISKAYIDLNFILDQLKPSLDIKQADAYFTYTKLKNNYNLPPDEADKAVPVYADPQEQIRESNINVLQMDASLGTHLAKRFLQTSFDIEVRGPATEDGGTIIMDAPYITLKDCTITSRTLQFSAAAVIVLTETSFVFKDVFVG